MAVSPSEESAKALFNGKSLFSNPEIYGELGGGTKTLAAVHLFAQLKPETTIEEIRDLMEKNRSQEASQRVR